MQIRMTLEGCPTVWEATLSSGEQLHIRYRFGELTVRTGLDEAANSLGQLLYSKSVGDSLGGILSTEEMLSIIVEEFLTEKTIK